MYLKCNFVRRNPEKIFNSLIFESGKSIYKSRYTNFYFLNFDGAKIFEITNSRGNKKIDFLNYK